MVSRETRACGERVWEKPWNETRNSKSLNSFTGNSVNRFQKYEKPTYSDQNCDNNYVYFPCKANKFNYEIPFMFNRPMKNILIFLFILVFSVYCKAQDAPVSKIILVRHAEKANDDPRDPSLSEKGKERAALLASLLKDVAVDAFYATPYKRTIETLSVLAEANKKNVLTYNPTDKNEITALFRANTGKTLVIAGHSNTVPPMVNLLIGKNEYPLMNDDDYGKIWILVFRGDELIDSTLLNY